MLFNIYLLFIYYYKMNVFSGFRDQSSNWEYGPIHLGDAFKYFFNNAKIIIYQGSIPINLMIFFSYIKARICF